ncbi:MAG TPA: hypothetical protein VIM99_14250 [Blastocatellia bacterium]
MNIRESPRRLIADWDGAFRKIGGFLSHGKRDLADYFKQRFIDGFEGGAIDFHYCGKMSVLRSITRNRALTNFRLPSGSDSNPS